MTLYCGRCGTPVKKKQKECGGCCRDLGGFFGAGRIPGEKWDDWYWQKMNGKDEWWEEA